MAVPTLTRTRASTRPSEPLAAAFGSGTTAVDLFADRVARWPERSALRHKVAGTWESISWGEYGTTVRQAAAGLVELGISVGDRVGILAGNQPRWHMADMAILSAAAVSVPSYPSSAASQVAHVLGHSGCRVCFVGDRDQLAKVLLVHRSLPTVQRIVILGPAPDGLDDDLLMTFEDLCALGRDRLERHPDTVDGRSRFVEPAALASIVYTSGTTGAPRGVLLTHANVVETIRAITQVVSVGPTDRFLSFLPLSHIAERCVSHFGQIVSGGETWFAQGLATLADDLRACRPTIFFAVPRVWEKFQAAILDELGGSPRPVRALADRYLRLGRERLDAQDSGTLRSPRQALAYLTLNHTLGARIRRALGFDRCRLFVSSAAPIHPGLLRWFHAVDVPIAEVYGMTESCGPATFNRAGRIRIGSVGEPLPGVEVRIAQDGEILVRGPNVCAGYHRDRAATAALVDAHGWMHTGDAGFLDGNQYLHVTGRKKDLIITSSGKNVAPQDLETDLATESLISQAVVIGDGHPYLTALIALDLEAVISHLGDHSGQVDLEALATHPVIQQHIDRSIQRINASRAPIERIKSWRILPRELTIVGGELTPTLKVRRQVVAGRFSELIDEMYAKAGGR